MDFLEIPYFYKTNQLHNWQLLYFTGITALSQFLYSKHFMSHKLIKFGALILILAALIAASPFIILMVFYSIALLQISTPGNSLCGLAYPSWWCDFPLSYIFIFLLSITPLFLLFGSKQRRAWTKVKFRRYWFSLVMAVLVLVAIGVQADWWGPNAWREHQEWRNYMAHESALRLRRERQKQEKRDWKRANPGQSFDEPGSHPQIIKIPSALTVVDAWKGESVLLSNGVVMLIDDLLRLHVTPTAALPIALPSLPAAARTDAPKLLTLDVRNGASLWSDGRVQTEIGTEVWNKEVRHTMGQQASSDPDRHGEKYYSYESRLPEISNSPLGKLHDVVAVKSDPSYSFIVVLRSNGQVHAFGEEDNAFGELGPQKIGPDGVPGFVMDNVVAIAVGERHTLALRKDGTVWMWGQDNLPLPYYTKKMPLPAQAFQPTPRKITLPAGIVKIAAGAGASYALTEDGAVWAWGVSSCLALDSEAESVRENVDPTLSFAYDKYANTLLRPMPVPGLTNIIDISAESCDTVALEKNGRVWRGGRNEAYHVIAGVKDVKQIFTSPGVTAFVKNDNTLSFLGSCSLCNNSSLNREIDKYLARNWGHTAAKGMWCGKVSEVTDLRKAFNQMVQNTRPEWKRDSLGFYRQNKPSTFSERNTALIFFNTLENDYLKGFDKETIAIRKGFTDSRPYASAHESKVWLDALYGDNKKKITYKKFDVHINSEDDFLFKTKYCPAVEIELREALEAISHREVELTRIHDVPLMGFQTFA